MIKKGIAIGTVILFVGASIVSGISWDIKKINHKVESDNIGINDQSVIENTINQDYFHMHISGIEYTKKGEKRHLSFVESDFPLEIVIQALLETGFSGTLICESPKRWEGDTELILKLLRGEQVVIPRKKKPTLLDYFK